MRSSVPGSGGWSVVVPPRPGSDAAALLTERVLSFLADR